MELKNLLSSNVGEHREIVNRLGRAYYELDLGPEAGPDDPIPTDYVYQAEEAVMCLKNAGYKVVKE